MLRYRGPIVAVVLIVFTLGASAAETLYGIEPGPYDVRTIEKLTVIDPVQDREIPLRILYPDGSGPFPLVVFSTGAFCYPQLYDRIATHWVTHGYVGHRTQPSRLPEQCRAADARSVSGFSAVSRS